ncbi:MAG: type II toxin-antitoxin system Phd/YefM family antitoxin [Betaproteobacteria bacterium]|nr:type II toxin-antitoxin system Phd/YefM family antitoxin [Betaproteobacteria bacterium]
MHAWPIQDAKARFSEMLATSLAHGPQLVTKHGKAAAVLVPIRQWNALQTAGRRTLKQVLLDRTAATDLVLPARGSLRTRKLS